MTRHLSLVRTDTGGPSPDYPEHGSRRVRWEPWHVGPRILCGKVETGCDDCGSRQPPWIARGLVEVPPGDRFTARRLSEGSSARSTSGPGRMIAQLIAFRCPTCRTLRMFDIGPEQERWVEISAEVTAPGLFTATELPPPIPKPPRPRKPARSAGTPADFVFKPPRRRPGQSQRRSDIVHPFQGDGVPDPATGKERCLYCELPRKKYDCHNMPEPTPEAIEMDLRRTGERVDE